MMNISEINTKIAEVQNKLEKLGFPKIPVVAVIGKLGRGLAGTACFKESKITVSSDYLKEFPDHMINVTVPHEICHLYVSKYMPRAKQFHGPEFKRVMRSIGLSGNTYHKMKLENGPVVKKRLKIRFVYVTQITCKEVNLTSGQHQKAVNGATFSYKGERIKYAGKKVVIK
ncbi:SprT-like domain-containing protein [Candidatus Dojkabacteria bacterium]|jgi:predicted SprT family Zn-dependent metalloprotease|nr:SprT-like domain-containing protein [Candidatus Dojkabacteria bacterium]